VRDFFKSSVFVNKVTAYLLTIRVMVEIMGFGYYCVRITVVKVVM